MPFGDALCNLTSPPPREPLDHPDLIRRADRRVTLTYEAAVCNGKKLRGLIETATTDARTWPYSALAENGWVEATRLIREIPAAVLTAMRAKGISTAEADMRHRYLSLDQPFKNAAGDTVQFGTGWYENVYNVRGGAIVAINNYSPTGILQTGKNPPLPKSVIEPKIPVLNRWSDLVWTMWTDSVARRGSTTTAGATTTTTAATASFTASASSLRYIFRDNVVNDNTKFVMERVAGMEDTASSVDALDLPYPGRTVDVNSDEGAALLGTPHGLGCAYLMIDHGQELGRRGLKITMYTAVEEGKNKYFLLFDMH